MARQVPSDLEDALAASPAARERFWSMPAERKDQWVRWIERARLPRARRRWIAETIRRLSAAAAPATAVESERVDAVGVVVSNSTAGSQERLRVSAGPNPKPATSVPDVTAEDAATAQQDLQAAGFTVIQVQWPVSDQSQNGMVVYEAPTGQAPEGSAIVIYVGSVSGG
jgi:Bacteriocin-protection, YdeI or OmpD-Associated/PASTA domain